MRILLTGASSFTGAWFARALAERGHQVTAVFPRRQAEYADLRARRVAWVCERAEPVFECRFGDERFLHTLAERGPFQRLCHHAAQVENYKSPDFDVVGALAANTHQARRVFEALAAQSGALVVTGSVFEPGEGAGSQGLPAFSPYGLSKALSHQVLAYHARSANVAYARFVIANPFGPLEEPRFTHYLVKNWFAGLTPAVNTPEYVRDNIHVSLLAQVYARFVESEFRPADAPARCGPCGYVETQGAFAQRFAAEMRPRLGLPCHVELRRQTEFPEPRIRINTDPPDAAALGWSESHAWDELAGYYRGLFGEGARG